MKEQKVMKELLAFLHPSALIPHPFQHPPATAGGTDLYFSMVAWLCCLALRAAHWS